MKKSALMIRFPLIVCFSLCAGASAFAATFTVNSTQDLQDNAPGSGACATGTLPPACTLRAAITEANAFAGDDIIILPAGTYQISLSFLGEDANAGGDFDITSNITINGAGAGSTFIQAGSDLPSSVERVMHFISGTSSVNGVTVRYGVINSGSSSGAGVLVAGVNTNVTLDSVTVSDNLSVKSAGGGVVVTNNAALTMNNSLINKNLSYMFGGAGFHLNSGTASINNTIISFNRASDSASDSTTIASAIGGGVKVSGGTLNLNNSSVSNNAAETFFPGAFTRGGGIGITGGTVTLTDSSVTNNITFSNSGTIGGGIYTLSTLTLNRAYISGNTAQRGGGIWTTADSLLGNTVTINQSAVVNNVATTTGTGTADGGGILNVGGRGDSTVIINNSTIAENKADDNGGGLMNIGFRTRIDLNFSTVARNTADQRNSSGGRGGGIRNISTGSGTQPVVNLKNSVVADNMVGTSGTNPDIDDVITSQGYNHVETVGTAAFTTTTGDVTGTDPALGSLVVNGSNSVFIPATNSPLVDTIPNGTNGCGTTAPFDVDQRGTSRPLDSNNDSAAACEKGAVELATLLFINGKIFYGVTPANQTPWFVPGVVLNAVLTDNNSIVATSTSDAAEGFYQLTGLYANNNYTVTLSKTGNINGITTFDATLVLRCVAAGAAGCALTDNQKLAADTNNSNSVTTFDATQILRFVAAGTQTTNTGQTGNWKFNPVSRPYAPLSVSQTGQNYDAILIGEVSGNWMPPTP